MAEFTMSLQEAIAALDGDIGLSEYPLFAPEYRETLNKKIIDHYLLQEIGLETPSMFRHAIRRRMNEIMPKYNALYRSVDGVTDYLVNFRTQSTREQTNISDSKSNDVSASDSTNDSDSKSRTMSSAFPQTMLADTGDYADTGADNASTATSKNVNTGTNDSTSESASSGSMAESAQGFSGRSVTDMLAELSENFMNIDLLIIEDLSDCFMQVWSNGSNSFRGQFGYHSAFYPNPLFY